MSPVSPLFLGCMGRTAKRPRSSSGRTIAQNDGDKHTSASTKHTQSSPGGTS